MDDGPKLALILGLMGVGGVVVGLFLIWIARRAEAYRIRREQAREELPALSLRRWAANGASIVASAASVWPFFKFIQSDSNENLVRLLLTSAIFAALGAALGAACCVAYRLVRGTAAAAPYVVDAAIAGSQVAANVVIEAKKSGLQKRLEELDRLHGQGLISQAERDEARRAAINRL